MEVHFAPELQAKIDQLVIDSGCSVEELIEDAIEAYLAELAQAREMLDSRYDDLKSGRVKPFPATRLLPTCARRVPPLAARAQFMIESDFHLTVRFTSSPPWP